MRTASGALVELTPDEQVWLKRKWALIRRSQQLADAASATWNEINESIKVKHRRENERREESGFFPKTDLMIAQEKSASLPLKDALATHAWHANEAQRHIDDVNLFLRMKEMGIL